ncbi:esterase [Bifidobacterium sp. DSM 109963]|uniref:Esterase n=2 Tax=Bifidobacterium panos TaxID=2675321 RepID=A0ABX1SVI7_9BIFI|nr:esterase [Bifidobacterium sp. DSM 109963]
MKRRMAVVSNSGASADGRSQWSAGRRLAVSLPIFIVMVGLLVSISNLTTVPWDNNPTGQTIETLTSDTAVTFAADETKGVSADTAGNAALDQAGTYEVSKRAVVLEVARDGTLVGSPHEVAVDENGDVSQQTPDNSTDTGSGTGDSDGVTQHITVLIREPVGAQGKHPGMVFLHGAGYGTAYNSFGDVAETLASAGFVTAVPDKPVWNTSDVTRDYPASARAYDAVVGLLRDSGNVDADKVGLYATSESSWIAQYVVDSDRRIAFQVLLSPMVFTPRQSLGFFVSQDFALVGANEGYQSIVRRVFNSDAALVGLHNFDLDLPETTAYRVPTLVAYGSKDVMTAQVEGAKRILTKAHEAGNWDVTIRSYPIANHVLRLGDESQSGTQFADDYLKDLTAWASGTALGLQQTSERVAGSTIYQSIAVPDELRPRTAMTAYGLILHVDTVLLLVITAVMWLVALGRRVRWRWGGRSRGASGRRSGNDPLGFTHGFGNALVTLSITTLATLLLFGAGLAQVILAVMRLDWGAAPDEEPGMIWWSWPVIQVVCTVVVWAWSRVFARLIEVAVDRGILAWPPRAGAIRSVVSGSKPVLASTRFARVLFWLTFAAMLHVLFVFAFWGLFIY